MAAFVCISLWIRIRMFLGHPDPLVRCTDQTPLVRGTNPAPDPEPLSSSKNGKKNLDSYCFVTPLCLLSFKNDVNVL